MSRENGFVEFEFDSPECAAIAHDFAILQMPECDRDDLNFSVNDLELLMRIAKGDFACSD